MRSEIRSAVEDGSASTRFRQVLSGHVPDTQVAINHAKRIRTLRPVPKDGFRAVPQLDPASGVVPVAARQPVDKADDRIRMDQPLIGQALLVDEFVFLGGAIAAFLL